MRRKGAAEPTRTATRHLPVPAARLHSKTHLSGTQHRTAPPAAALPPLRALPSHRPPSPSAPPARGGPGDGERQGGTGTQTPPLFPQGQGENRALAERLRGRNHLKAQDPEPQELTAEHLLPSRGLCFRNKRKTVTRTRIPVSPGGRSHRWPGAGFPPVSRWLRPASLWPRAPPSEGHPSENAGWAVPASFPADRTARHRDSFPRRPPHRALAFLPDQVRMAASQEKTTKINCNLRSVYRRCGSPPSALRSELWFGVY